MGHVASVLITQLCRHEVEEVLTCQQMGLLDSRLGLHTYMCRVGLGPYTTLGSYVEKLELSLCLLLNSKSPVLWREVAVPFPPECSHGL